MSDVQIEATGAPAACSRCGRPAPRDEAVPAAWGSLFMNGRLVQIACPDCLTDGERAQLEERDGASMWEVASARVVSTARLRELAETARRAGRLAPSAEWLDGLAPAGSHAGLLPGEADGRWLLVVWAGEAPGSGRSGSVMQVAADEWLALDEVYVPYALQRWAAEAIASLRQVA